MLFLLRFLDSMPAERVFAPEVIVAMIDTLDSDRARHKHLSLSGFFSICSLANARHRELGFSIQSWRWSIL